MQLVDSHCHINFSEFALRLPEVFELMARNDVGHALCISVNLPEFPSVLALAEQYPNVFATVGVHPDYEDETEPDVEMLVKFAQHPRIVGIGETGLDYFRLKGDLSWQRERFRTHIRAARAGSGCWRRVPLRRWRRCSLPWGTAFPWSGCHRSGKSGLSSTTLAATRRLFSTM